MRRVIAPMLVLAVAPFVDAHAATPQPSPRPAQLGMCAACHGEDGFARIPGAPNLAGQPYQYLLQALRAYRNGGRNVPVMNTAAGPLGERDMQALARWYAAQTPCKPSQADEP